MKFRAPKAARLADPEAEAARRELAQKVVELQKTLTALLEPIQGVQLKNGIETTVAHKLGRTPLFVKESCIRGAATVGMVQLVSATATNVILVASGYGATVTCSVAVW